MESAALKIAQNIHPGGRSEAKWWFSANSGRPGTGGTASGAPMVTIQEHPKTRQPRLAIPARRLSARVIAATDCSDLIVFLVFNSRLVGIQGILGSKFPSRPHPQSQSSTAGTAAHSLTAPATAPPDSYSHSRAATTPESFHLPTARAS